MISHTYQIGQQLQPNALASLSHFYTMHNKSTLEQMMIDLPLHPPSLLSYSFPLLSLSTTSSHLSFLIHPHGSHVTCPYTYGLLDTQQAPSPLSLRLFPSPSLLPPLSLTPPLPLPPSPHNPMLSSHTK